MRNPHFCVRSTFNGQEITVLPVVVVRILVCYVHCLKPVPYEAVPSHVFQRTILSTLFISEWITAIFNMADCFNPKDVERLLAGKHVVFLGDSVTRGIYKVGNLKEKKHFSLENFVLQDFVWLANDNSLLPAEQLKVNHLPTFPDIEATRYIFEIQISNIYE